MDLSRRNSALGSQTPKAQGLVRNLKRRASARTPWLAFGCLSLAIGCAPDAEFQTPQTPVGDAAASVPAVNDLPGDSISLILRPGTLQYLNLSRVELVDVEHPESSTDWDLKFDGLEIFTNSGPSGPGLGAAFGPADELNFLYEEAPEVPFLREDRSGGAFLDWYLYDGASHALYSRYHSYGVRTPQGLFKVQVLSYYGDDAGASVSARYQVRYAAVQANGSAVVVTQSELDATAGGSTGTEDSPSACLNLATEELTLLTPQAAADDSSWHLCFRRDTISVGSEALAVDLNAEQTADEALSDVQARTADGELEAFEAIGYAELTDPALIYRADGIVSAFSDRWYTHTGSGLLKPVAASWFVRAADGEHNYLLVPRTLETLDTADGGSELRLSLRIRPLVP